MNRITGPLSNPQGPGQSNTVPPASAADRTGGAQGGLSSTPEGEPNRPMRVLRGIAVSPGVAIGPARTLDPLGRELPARAIRLEAVKDEIERLQRTLDAARDEAAAAEVEARARLGPDYAAILGAHARMIDDPTLRAAAAQRIQHNHIAAEYAVIEVLEAISERLAALADAHLAARAADVRDVLSRILDRFGAAHPTQASSAGPQAVESPCVVLTHELSPSQTARLDPTRVLGFATEAGGPTSHTAIVAAALEIPAVVALGPFLDASTLRAANVIVDGDEGRVILDPDEATLEQYHALAAARATRLEHLAHLAHLPAQTRDGHAIELMGNIEFLAEADGCRARGGRGVGLFRTEFLYLNADTPPTEDDQYNAYAAVVRAVEGGSVTIRTLDLGADKVLGMSSAGMHEMNPSLGLRSLRLSLREPALFRAQLRALLRAAALGDVRILFPLVATLGEFRQARQWIADVAAELERDQIPHRGTVPVGAMIEVPAAALMADHLAREVDFFSIGTNDLIQYTLAADRTNEYVASLYDAADPSVLRLIKMVVDAARPYQRPVNLCGSMGGEALYTPLLLGLGLTQLSMPPHQLLEIKRMVRAVSLADAEALAREVLAMETSSAVMARLRETFATIGSDEPAEPGPPGQASRPAHHRPRASRPRADSPKHPSEAAHETRPPEPGG